MDQGTELCADACGSCRAAVIRTYREFRRLGEGDRDAFRAALQLLSLRHPERSREACLALASEWLAETET